MINIHSLQVDQFPVKIDWFPQFTDLRRALDIYGFLFKFSSSADDIILGNSYTTTQKQCVIHLYYNIFPQCWSELQDFVSLTTKKPS